MARTISEFPFAALVALDDLKLALQLAAIDRRLSVLLRGDKGAGKSTAARGLGALLQDAPFVNLPIGATEDRILGGLDIARTLNGEPALKPGLLAAAHGGILYIDEVNLLPDHLADAMLDAVASGVHVVEREGLSARQDADFVLIGSMNPEEGTLRPQLLDRFALVVDVSAPLDPAARRMAVERRLAFDRDPAAFAEAWRAYQEALAGELARARRALADVTIHEELLDLVSEQVCAHGVRSLRADLAIVRAARALAALEGVETVTSDHIARVVPLALRHRISSASRLPEAPPPPPPPPPSHSSSNPPDSDGNANDGPGGNGSGEAMFAPLPMSMPRIVAPGRAEAAGRAPAMSPPAASGANAAAAVARGPAIGARQVADPREMDVRASIVHAIGHTGSARPRRDDLHEVVRKPIGGRRYLFVIDASGSQAARQRMRLVKGAVDGLLGNSVRRGDEVAIVSFRGPSAEIVLAPTSDAEAARQALHYLPTGGRTPLAHAFELAAGLVTDDTVFILLTDGRANVALHSEDPWADALAAATRVACPALVIDSEAGPNASGRAREIAAGMRATYQSLDAIDSRALIDLIRPS